MERTGEEAGLMVATREKFSSQASPDLLAALRQIARDEGRHFQVVLEDAMQEYLDSKARGKVRPEVMAHYRASVERHRRLYELLAK